MMVERLPECNASLTVSAPCMAASWRFSPCGPRPPPGAPSPSVSEQVAEAQRVRHLQERRIVLRVGQHPLFPPAPRGLGMDVETAVYLRPRQVGLLLEPHQALREVGWEARGSSAVMNALSRHGTAGPSGYTAGASLQCKRKHPLFSPPQTLADPVPGRYACLTRLSICACFFRCPIASLVRPCVRPSLRFKALRSQAVSLLSEQVAETQVIGQAQQRIQMPVIGPDTGLPPAPYGHGRDPEAAGDLRRRQPDACLNHTRRCGKSSGNG